MAVKSEIMVAPARSGLFARLRAWLKQGASVQGITKEEAIAIVHRYYEEQGWSTHQTFFEAQPSTWRDGSIVVPTFEVGDGWKDSGHIHVRRSDGKLLVLTVLRQPPTAAAGIFAQCATAQRYLAAAASG